MLCDQVNPFTAVIPLALFLFETRERSARVSVWVGDTPSTCSGSAGKSARGITDRLKYDLCFGLSESIFTRGIVHVGQINELWRKPGYEFCFWGRPYGASK